MKALLFRISIGYIFCCASIHAQNLSMETERLVKMSLSSPAFENGGNIPTIYTCDGKNISPPLTIHGVTKKAQSLMLLIVDKEASAPPDQAISWFVYNIPPQTKTITPNQAFQTIGRNSNGTYAYLSPCPTEGTHHYYFSLYALDMVLPETVNSMQEASGLTNGHLVGYASLMGTYTRK